MKIIVAQTACFCMGVHRAVNLAVDTAASGVENIYTLGPLIHNNQTLDLLKERGIRILDDTNPPPSDATILIRAHGIPPKTHEQYASVYKNILDGTCPKVKTVHKVIQKYRSDGYSIIITGDKGHAEVIGLQGYAAEAGFLIQSPDDVDNLPDLKKICLVSQTTFNRDTFDLIAQKIKAHFPTATFVLKRTICSATDKRQQETAELSKKVDAMIVVGGRNSANTTRLVEIAIRSQTPTIHVETEDELTWDQIKNYKTIGITAGASTPAWMIQRISNHIAMLERSNKKNLIGWLYHVIERFANLNFFIALGGCSMYYFSTVLQELPFCSIGAFVAFLYLVSIYLWNSLQSIEKNKHLDLSRYRFYSNNKTLLTILTICFIIIFLSSSLLHSVNLLLLMLVPTGAGIIYQITIVPKPLQKILQCSNLKDIPLSRDIFTALAWAVLITFVPQVTNSSFEVRPTTAAIFAWSFFLALLRSLIVDLRDIEGDRIMGRETLVTVIGEKLVHRFIVFSLLGSLVGLVTLSLLARIPDPLFSRLQFFAFLSQIPVLVYILIFMRVVYKNTQNNPTIFTILADGHFYVAGIGALMVKVALSL